jgi:hypothetical protein
MSSYSLLYDVKGSDTYGSEDQETLYFDADEASLALIGCLRASVFQIVSCGSMDANAVSSVRAGFLWLTRSRKYWGFIGIL